jgi:hypothetical protein
VLSISIKEASNVTNSALEGAIVGTIFVEKALVLATVHDVFSWCVLGLHVGVLRSTGPIDQILARLQGGSHDGAWEQVIVLGLQSALHIRLLLDRGLIKVECAVAHQSFPLLGLELVIACHFEHDWVLSPGWLAHSVLARIGLLRERHTGIFLTFGLLLVENVRKLTVEDGITRLLTQLCFDLGSILHYFSPLPNNYNLHAW